MVSANGSPCGNKVFGMGEGCYWSLWVQMTVVLKHYMETKLLEMGKSFHGTFWSHAESLCDLCLCYIFVTWEKKILGWGKSFTGNAWPQDKSLPLFVNAPVHKNKAFSMDMSFVGPSVAGKAFICVDNDFGVATLFRCKFVWSCLLYTSPSPRD